MKEAAQRWFEKNDPEGVAHEHTSCRAQASPKARRFAQGVRSGPRSRHGAFRTPRGADRTLGADHLFCEPVRMTKLTEAREIQAVAPPSFVLTCDRFFTAPFRALSPVGLLTAMASFSHLRRK